MKRSIKNQENPFHIRYVKVVDEWEVLDKSGVVYMGTRENCQSFIKTCNWLSIN
ncbi:MAG: hypothetical protein AAFY41_08645 [Bacteroidota bacterium]